MTILRVKPMLMTAFVAALAVSHAAAISQTGVGDSSESNSDGEPQVLGGSGGMPGSWSRTKPTHALKKTLVAALSAEKYGNGVETRLCVTQLMTMEQQVVSGMNYLFHVLGCPVDSVARSGDCTGEDTNCATAKYAIRVYEQSWTDTLEVKSIEREDAKPGQMTMQEKKLIEKWIKKNKLNQYGDHKNMHYTGGTPLFNETTATRIDRYDYIVSKHTDRPWLPIHGAMKAMLGEEPMSMSTTTEPKILVARSKRNDDTYIKGLATFGVFTILIALVALVKTRQGARRRFTYDSVSNREIL